MKHWVGWSAIGALCWSAWARAEDTSELEGALDERVVSAASKGAEASSTAPATSVSISAEEMRRHGIMTLDEAINFLALGMQMEPFLNTAEAGSRGVLLTSDFGAHVLVLVDGHAVNEQWGATAYFDRGLGVPFELIDHIELIIGPGSVLYGSNAMLGVINVVTKRAKDFSGVHVIAESELPVSIRGAVGYGREFELFGNDAELSLEAEYYHRRGPTLDYPTYDAGPDPLTGLPRQYSAEQPPGIWGGRGDDSYFAQSPAGYLRFRTAGFELGLRGSLYKRSNPTESGNFDDTESFELDRWLAVDLKYSASLSRVAQMSARIYADRYDYRQDWNSDGAIDCLEGQDSGCLWRLLGHARWIGVEPQLNLDWLGDRTLVTLVGVDGRYKSVGSNVNYYDHVTGDSPGPVGAFDRREQSLGAYVQQTYWPVAVLGLNVGARWDVDSRFGQAISPRAAATWIPWRKGALKLIYSEAFRAPTAWEVYYTDPRSQIAGGNDLEPERVRSVEASIEQRFGAQRLFLSVFRNWWRDLVLLEDLDEQMLQSAIDSGELLPDTPYGGQLQNVSRIDSYGFNAGYDGSLEQGALRYGLSVNRAFARTIDAAGISDLLPVAAPTFGNARISYDLVGDLPELALAARFVSRRPADGYSIDVPQLAGAQVELRLAITGALPLPGLSYRVTANYAFNDQAAYVVGPGPADGSPSPLGPVDQFRTSVALQYDFLE